MLVPPLPGLQKLKSHVHFALSLNGEGGHVTQNMDVILWGWKLSEKALAFQIEKDSFVLLLLLLS